MPLLKVHVQVGQFIGKCSLYFYIVQTRFHQSNIISINYMYFVDAVFGMSYIYNVEEHWCKDTTLRHAVLDGVCT